MDGLVAGGGIFLWGRAALVLAAAVGVAGCEKDTQPTPMDVHAQADGLTSDQERARFGERDAVGPVSAPPSPTVAVTNSIVVKASGGAVPPPTLLPERFSARNARELAAGVVKTESVLDIPREDDWGRPFDPEEDRELEEHRERGARRPQLRLSSKLPGSGDIRVLAATDPTPNPTFTFSTVLTNKYGGIPTDAQLAVSPTHVCVTARAALFCYTKGGRETYVEGVKHPLGRDFFASALSGAGDDIFDMRAMYDHYHDRFWIVGLTTKSARVAVAVSQSGNPRKGWYKYWLNGTDSRAPRNHPDSGTDYPYIGIDDKAFYVVNTVESPTRGDRYFLINVADANGMASGRGSASGWVFWDLATPDGNPYLTVTRHETTTSRGYMVANYGTNKLSVFAVNNPLTSSQSVSRVDVNIIGFDDPINGPQKRNTGAPSGTPPVVDFGVTGNRPLQVMYRNSSLIVTANDSDRVENGARLIHLDVQNYATGSVPVVKDRFFKNAGWHYGFPAAAINNFGDVGITTIRTNSTVWPEVRASAWYGTESDIRPSVLAQASQSAAFSYDGDPCACISHDTIGASVDPYDKKAIYFSQQFAGAAGFSNHRISIIKLFGATRPDISANSYDVAPTTVARGAATTATFTAVNQGDAPMPASKARWYLSTNAFISSADTPLGPVIDVASIDVAAVSATSTTSLTIPAGTAKGNYFIGLCLDTTSVATEFSEGNNCHDGATNALGLEPIPVTVN